MDRPHTDSRHWSQRWMRVAMIDSDAVILYDLHAPVRMTGCGRCRDVTSGVFTQGRRYRVTRFWDIATCRECGRLDGYGIKDRTLYFGDSEADALEAYQAAEATFFEAA